jgi:hypothetical protein
MPGNPPATETDPLARASAKAPGRPANQRSDGGSVHSVLGASRQLPGSSGKEETALTSQTVRMSGDDRHQQEGWSRAGNEVVDVHGSLFGFRPGGVCLVV